jgi:hypothetical protein
MSLYRASMCWERRLAYVECEGAEKQPHPSYLSLPSRAGEHQVQAIQPLRMGETSIRLMDDSVYKLRTPKVRI